MRGVMDRKGEREVLMLCYHYPPAVNGGVARSVRFVRRLPSYGWHPVVVTSGRFGRQGPVGEEGIVRVGELSLRGFGAGGLSPGSEGPGRGRPADPAPGPAVQHGSGRPASPAGRLVTAAAGLADRWLLVPDDKIRWAALAVLPAWRQVRREEVSAIYTTSPPSSLHLLGMLLKRLSGKPWIMDLRDPWTFEPLSRFLRRGGFRLRLERRIERACFGLADMITVTTPEAVERYAELYPAHAAKLRTLTNGFDPEEIAEAASSMHEAGALAGIGEDVFVVSHIGTFSRLIDTGAYPRALLRALKKLAEEAVIDRGGFRVLFVGRVPAATRREVRALGLGNLVEFCGALSHTDSLRVMMRSDLLLLVDPSRRADYYVHGKLYEYLASGKPILAVLGGEGASRRLLERLGGSLFADFNDAGGIGREIASAVRRGRGAGIPYGPGIERYEAGYLTGELARILEELHGNTGPGGRPAGKGGR